MKATLRLEYIGQGIAAKINAHRNLVDGLLPGVGSAAFGSGNPLRPWVAEIVGRHPTYKYERAFLDANTDYSQSNSNGNRGVYLWYILESSRLYEVSSLVSWKSRDRYFCRVTDTGEICRIDASEVERCLNAR